MNILSRAVSPLPRPYRCLIMFFGRHHLWWRTDAPGAQAALSLIGTEPGSKGTRQPIAQQVVKRSDQWLLYQESRTRSIHKQSTDQCIKEKWSLKHMRSILTCWLRLRISAQCLPSFQLASSPWHPTVYTVKQWQPDLKHYIPMTIQNLSLLLKFRSKASNIMKRTIMNILW